MDDCIFCKIINGEIPASKVYEDEKVLAFLDIAPVNKGHTLVIPKKHHETLLDMPDNLLADVMKATKKVAKAVIKAARTDGFNIMQSNKQTAGQVVPHFHLHIIPRLEKDGLKHWPGKKYEEGEMEKIAADIKSLL
ncbi:HIT family protein [Candidatus Woesearchaeota archaeon]|nr:HIT family protein [Candidatus Woesearchaeota archaeon]